MKFLLSLLAVVATTSAGTLNAREAVSTLSISSEIVKAIEGIRDQMSCGFEKFGIPPLAPLKIGHQEIALNRESAKIDGEVNTVRVDGLNEFNIDTVTANVITSRIKVQLTFPKISVEGLYGLAAILKSYGITVNVQGAGDMYVAVSDIVINVDVKYSLGLGSKQIKLKAVRVVVNLGDADVKFDGILGKGFVNQKLNEVIEKMILMSVNDNQEAITNFLDRRICNSFNSVGLTLGDLLGGGGGGDGRGKSTVCTPP